MHLSSYCDDAVRQAERGMFRQEQFLVSVRGCGAGKALQSQILSLDLSWVCFPGASPPIRERVS